MSIRFYVSWYLGDPDYPTYVSDCALLLSPTSLARNWTVRDLPTLPSRLILDSGGFRYLNSDDRAPSAGELLLRQLAILDHITIPTLLCPLDSPLGQVSLSIVSADQLIAQTLAHAFELQRLIRRIPLPYYVEPMAIVQGNDAATLSYCARELVAMGYCHFGLGSLARVPDPAETARRVETVFAIVQRPLHLFGVASPQVLRSLNSTWVASVDSSRPAKASACNELIYSRPFRRYGIATEDGISRSRLPSRRCLVQPLPCICPVCHTDPTAVIRIGRRDHIRARAIHNYYHLRISIEETFRASHAETSNDDWWPR